MLQWSQWVYLQFFAMSFQFRAIFHWTMIRGIPGYQNHGILRVETCDSPASNKNGYRNVKFSKGNLWHQVIQFVTFRFPQGHWKCKFWVQVTFSLTIPKRSRNPSIATKMFTNFDRYRWGWRRGEMPSLPSKLGDVNFGSRKVSTADKLYIYVYTRWFPYNRCKWSFFQPLFHGLQKKMGGSLGWNFTSHWLELFFDPSCNW